MTVTDADPALSRLMTQFFREQSPPERVAAAEYRDGDTDLWRAVAEMGLPFIAIEEEFGGHGGTLADLLVVLTAAGRSCAPIPIAETAAAAWALTRAGVKVGDDPLTVVPGDPRDSLSIQAGRATGTLHQVPWGRVATVAVSLVASDDGTSLVAIPLDEASCLAGHDLAGQPKDTVNFESVPVTALPWPGHPDEARLRLMLLRGALMAGALAEVADLTRRYVTERVQFDQPIGSFQYVQEHVVRLEQQATLALLALRRAGFAAGRNPSAVQVKMLKFIANEGARIAVRAAHQAHGAIGMTQEYRLQLLTRRLNSWLGEVGTSAELASDIGTQAMQRGLPQLITSPGQATEVESE